MRQFQHELVVATTGRGAFELTRDLAGTLDREPLTTGICHLFCRHTSASLTIQENADPTVLQDLSDWLGRLAPDGDPAYRHAAEGPDDMPAHLRTLITSTTLSIPIVEGRLALGTWQGLFLLEHRTHPHRRRVVVHASGT